MRRVWQGYGGRKKKEDRAQCLAFEVLGAPNLSPHAFQKSTSHRLRTPDSTETLDPIVALATPPGRGGLAVIRVSGTALLEWFPASVGWRGAAPLKGLRRILDDRGDLIDRVLVLSFAGPRSFSGEDTLELHCHGSPVVVETLIARLLQLGRTRGLRLAGPGEFSQRAYLNGRIDLAQAEALADLIASETALQARAAARAMEGDVSARVQRLLDRVQHLRLLVEAALDFPEEPVESLANWGVDEAVAACAADLKTELPIFRHGARLQQGFRVALIGPPNVGKSSLLNALAGKDLAIVDPEPGTTRDRIEQAIDLLGYRIVLTDTAGIRPVAEAGRIEALGIERSWQAAAQADLVLLMTSAEDALAWSIDAMEHWPSRFHAEAADWFRAHAPTSIFEHGFARVCIVINKIDLLPPECQRRLLETFANREPGRFSLDAPDPSSVAQVVRFPPAVTVSLALSASPMVVCSTGASPAPGQKSHSDQNIGLDHLVTSVGSILGLQNGQADPVLARARHVDALERALAHLEGAAECWQSAAGQADLMAEELRLAQRSLGEILGAWSNEDLLGEIFSRFCIGK
jgi:tRNA modification GTPase